MDFSLSGLRRTAAWLPLAVVIGVAAGCSNVEKVKARPTPARVDRTFEIVVPQIMRGTVGAEAIMDGYRPVLVRGYGLVVGLNGTGHRDIPQDLRAHMIAVASSHGVGSPNSGWSGLSPERLLDSLDTAVVVVEGLVPPGAKEGTRFDVRVVAHPQTRPQSLEGGRLYTAELQPSALFRLPPTGSRQAAALAEANGPLFINPFAEPGAIEQDTINRNRGMILQGGRVLKDVPIKLRLAHPSHARARSLQSVINAQFPQEPGQKRATAHGESDESILITVPPSFTDDPQRFVDLLRCTSVEQGEPERVGLAVKRLLLNDPSLGAQATLRWQTLGPRVLPVIRELYDYPEEQPRFAALQAGARLSDSLVVAHLVDLARRGSVTVRRDAIELLSDMAVNPRIDHGLRALLDDPDVEIRLASYEALAKRGDPLVQRTEVDGKFVIDVVESSRPLIYVTQIGQPRIALLGQELAIDRPLTMAAWSNRLMVLANPGDEQVEVYYQEPHAAKGTISRCSPRLRDFVEFLGHRTTVDEPKPGLGLSYSQTVGALHQLWSQRFVKADFKAEQDRLLAAILEQERESSIVERPEIGQPQEDGFPADSEVQPISDLGRLTPLQMPGASDSTAGTPR